MAGLSVIYGILPPMPTPDPIRLRRRRAEHPAGHGPADRRPLLRHRGATSRCPTAAPRGSSSPTPTSSAASRLWVDEQGQPVPHLLVPRGRDLQAGVQQADPHRRCQRQDAVRGDRAQARHRWPRVAVGRTTRRSARATCRDTVPVAFTSYSGMDIGRDNGLVVDLAYEDQAPYAFTGTVKRVVFDLHADSPRGRASAPRARRDPGRGGGRGRLIGAVRRIRRGLTSGPAERPYGLALPRCRGVAAGRPRATLAAAEVAEPADAADLNSAARKGV